MYSLEQYTRDRQRAALGAPYAAYRCSQYYFRTVLPAKWRALKLWSRHVATASTAAQAMHYNTWGIHTTWKQIWHYFWIAHSCAKRTHNQPLLETLEKYKKTISEEGKNPPI